MDTSPNTQPNVADETKNLHFNRTSYYCFNRDT